MSKEAWKVIEPEIERIERLEGLPAVMVSRVISDITHGTARTGERMRVRRTVHAGIGWAQAEGVLHLEETSTGLVLVFRRAWPRMPLPRLMKNALEWLAGGAS